MNKLNQTTTLTVTTGRIGRIGRIGRTGRIGRIGRTTPTALTAQCAILGSRITRAALLSIALAACAIGAIEPALAAIPADAAPSRDEEQRNRQFQHAEALYLSGRLKEAAAAFELLTRAYPRDARIWLKYGNTLTKLGSYDEAALAFQNAANFDPALGSPALNLALVRLGQAQAALDVALARLDPNSPEHLQAESLQRQIKALLDTSEHGTSTH